MSLISVADAAVAIVAQAPQLPVTEHSLSELSGAVLAQAIIMERDQPPFDRVTMDGIAMSSDAAHLRKLRMAGTQGAGSAPLQLPDNTHCIEVMTGAELPHGCDCVIPVERLRIADGHAELEDSVQPAPGLNVHRRGSDARAGAVLLQPGMRLGPVEAAIIASAGYARASVRSSPRIALVSSGDELIEPGQPIATYQVRRSNTYALHAALQRHGHLTRSDMHLPDDLPTLRQHLATLLDTHDVLILSGGVSMGKFDFIPQALTELGVRCVFHSIAQRPGKPMWFGVRDDGKTVYALPGNPVSTLICLYRYVLPGLDHAMGATRQEAATLALAGDAKPHPQLTVFVPVQLRADRIGITTAMPRPTRGSGDFISLLGTDGFVELPPASSPIENGAVVPLYRW